MTYSRTADHFIAKGRQAKLELFNLFFKAKIYNLDVELSVFESLVKSVVMQCYHIWGVSFIEKLKSFQFSFLRQLFRLPHFTLHWFLLIESSCKKIELSFLKNLLMFWLKIKSKPKDSLISRCYDFLLLKKDNCKLKHNWVRDMMSVLNTYDCCSLLIDDFNVSDATEITIFKSQVSKYLLLMKS
jgi:hypothetical protein